MATKHPSNLWSRGPGRAADRGTLRAQNGTSAQILAEPYGYVINRWLIYL